MNDLHLPVLILWDADNYTSFNGSMEIFARFALFFFLINTIHIIINLKLMKTSQK